MAEVKGREKKASEKGRGGATGTEFPFPTVPDMKMWRGFLRKKNSRRRGVEQLRAALQLEPAFRQLEFLDCLKRWVLHFKEIPSDLSEVRMRKLCQDLEYLKLGKDEVVFRQGDIGSEYYMIISGEVAIYIDPAAQADQDELTQLAQEVREFDKLETEILGICNKEAKLLALWRSIDTNAAGAVSLEDIATVMSRRYPLLRHRDPLQMAHNRTQRTMIARAAAKAAAAKSAKATSKSKKATVDVAPVDGVAFSSFASLMRDLFYYSRVCHALTATYGGTIEPAAVIDPEQFEITLGQLGMLGNAEEMEDMYRECVEMRDEAWEYISCDHHPAHPQCLLLALPRTRPSAAREAHTLAPQRTPTPRTHPSRPSYRSSYWSSHLFLFAQKRREVELDDFVDWLILTRSRQRSSGGEQRNEKALLGLMDENKIAVLSAGDGFGEGALTRSSGARGATIVTNCETEFAVLKKETYDLNVKAHQQEQVATNMALLQQNPVLKGLSDGMLRILTKVAKFHRVGYKSEASEEDEAAEKDGEVDETMRKFREGLIFEAGDPPSSLFVVLKGHLQALADVRIPHLNSWPAADGEGHEEYRTSIMKRMVCENFQPGDMFGTEAVLDDPPPRQLTVMTAKPSLIAEIYLIDFSILGRQALRAIAAGHKRVLYRDLQERFMADRKREKERDKLIADSTGSKYKERIVQANEDSKFTDGLIPGACRKPTLWPPSARPENQIHPEQFRIDIDKLRESAPPAELAAAEGGATAAAAAAAAEADVQKLARAQAKQRKRMHRNNIKLKRRPSPMLPLPQGAGKPAGSPPQGGGSPAVPGGSPKRVLGTLSGKTTTSSPSRSSAIRRLEEGKEELSRKHMQLHPRLVRLQEKLESGDADSKKMSFAHLRDPLLLRVGDGRGLWSSSDSSSMPAHPLARASSAPSPFLTEAKFAYMPSDEPPRQMSQQELRVAMEASEHSLRQAASRPGTALTLSRPPSPEMLSHGRAGSQGLAGPATIGAAGQSGRRRARTAKEQQRRAELGLSGIGSRTPSRRRRGRTSRQRNEDDAEEQMAIAAALEFEKQRRENRIDPRRVRRMERMERRRRQKEAKEAGSDKLRVKTWRFLSDTPVSQASRSLGHLQTMRVKAGGYMEGAGRARSREQREQHALRRQGARNKLLEQELEWQRSSSVRALSNLPVLPEKWWLTASHVEQVDAAGQAENAMLVDESLEALMNAAPFD